MVLHFDRTGEFKHQGKWLLLSRSKPQRVLYIFGSKKPSKERFLKEERRVQYFKHFGAVPKLIKVRAHRREGKFVRKHLRKHIFYSNLIRSARRKGFKIPHGKKGKGPLAYDEADIPEDFMIDGFTMPIEEPHRSWNKKLAKKQKGKYLIIMDDDATKNNKKLAFAHELSHVHMFEKKEKPHTEPKAEKYAAKILGLTKERYDKLSEGMTFDQDVHKPGIQLLSRRKK